MGMKHHPTDTSRRDFLKAAAVTAMAATATGSAAALLSGAGLPDASLQRAVLSGSPSAIPPAETVATDVFAQLVAARAENVRLRASLDALQRRVVAADDRTLDSQEDILRLELEAATDQISVLSGLIALYEHLESIDLGQLALDGITSVSSGIGTLLAEIPGLTESLETGRQALQELEDQLPALQRGQHWILEQVEQLQGHFDGVETLLRRAAEATAPVVQLLNEWVQDVLRWLPFGLGERAGAILDAIITPLLEIPQLAAGLFENVAQPLGAWVDGEVDELPLQRKLVRPMRELVLERAQLAAMETQRLATTYRAALEEPVVAAAGSQQTVMDLIAEYRHRHQM